jgi:hypothetical protein
VHQVRLVGLRAAAILLAQPRGEQAPDAKADQRIGQQVALEQRKGQRGLSADTAVVVVLMVCSEDTADARPFAAGRGLPEAQQRRRRAGVFALSLTLAFDFAAGTPASNSSSQTVAGESLGARQSLARRASRQADLGPVWSPSA